MLTLVTGTPGAFKTTYAVWELLRPIPGTFIEGNDGERIERKLHCNINDLLVEHQHIDATDLTTWHQWCKPGDVICFDEVQHVWRPRGLGTKVPEEIAALETHRHKGVDIILITQHPMLLDPNIRRLVNRHIHMRRLATGLSWRYEWDHCANPQQVKSAMTNGPWIRKKEAFSLFKSAQAHTKTVARIPPVAFLLIPALIALAVFAHRTYNNLWGSGDAEPSAPVPSLVLPIAPDAPRPLAKPENAPGVAALANSGPMFMGCVASATSCRCYGTTGLVVDVDADACRAHVTGPSQIEAYSPPGSSRTPPLTQDPLASLETARGPHSPE